MREEAMHLEHWTSGVDLAESAVDDTTATGVDGAGTSSVTPADVALSASATDVAASSGGDVWPPGSEYMSKKKAIKERLRVLWKTQRP